MRNLQFRFGAFSPSALIDDVMIWRENKVSLLSMHKLRDNRKQQKAKEHCDDHDKDTQGDSKHIRNS